MICLQCLIALLRGRCGGCLQNRQHEENFTICVTDRSEETLYITPQLPAGLMRPVCFMFMPKNMPAAPTQEETLKIKTWSAMAAILSGLTIAAAAHADETISVKLGYMLLSPSGQFASSGNAIAGTRIDMESDLNFDNSLQPTGEVAVSLGDSVLSLGYIPLDFSGSGALNRTVSFNGQNFALGTTATSSFKADIIDFGYTRYLINMDDLPSRFS